ncbi:hypothetical protein PybrP1_010175 [[Pythium] brassicae (nom. inval.)]|nr:hypothetical protein PybrP1_010175 [[Pythium] brassicae (nom. inval.)]
MYRGRPAPRRPAPEGPTSAGVGSVPGTGYEAFPATPMDPNEHARWSGSAAARVLSEAETAAISTDVAVRHRSLGDAPRRTGSDDDGDESSPIILSVNFFHVTLDPQHREIFTYNVIVKWQDAETGERVEITSSAFSGASSSDTDGAAPFAAFSTPRTSDRQPHKELSRAVVDAAMAQFGAEFEGVQLVHDGMHTLYAPSRLPWRSKIFEDVTLPGDVPNREGRRRTFSVQIKFVDAIPLRDFQDYVVDPSLNERPLLQALEVAARHTAIKRLVPIGRAFFSTKDGHPMRGGRELCWGYYQSVRMGEDKLLLNLDQAAKLFYAAGPLTNLVMATTKARDPRTVSAGDRSLRILSVVLRKLAVVPTHRERAHKRPICGLSARSAADTMFEADGAPVSVADYFSRQYSVRLRYPNLPPVNVGSPARPVWLPMELCELAPGQRCPIVSEADTVEIIKQTAQRPDARVNHIMEQACRAGFENDPVLAAFGMKVKLEMERVVARRLAAPTVQFATVSEQPVLGAWNLRNRQFVDGKVLRNWGVVIHPQLQADEIKKMLVKICSTVKQLGMELDNLRIPVVRRPPGEATDIEQMLLETYKALAGRRDDGPPQFILVVMQDKSTPLYAEIKRTSDTLLGLPSQCLVWTKACKNQDTYFANVCLKINMKLGGKNWVPRDPLPLVSAAPTIVIGAHIHHARSARNLRPSVAAVAASIDRYSARYVTRMTTQAVTLPHIYALADMVRDVLVEFFCATGRQPAHIVYYRDGLGENQFANVLQNELPALRRACLALSANYLPPVTFVAVTREHRMRSFCVDRNDCDVSGNVPPGTVVDAGIVGPARFEFYLYGHSGIQGTSRPAHYTVLHDGNNLPLAQVEKLSYYLCYTYARSTRSVSVPTPVYYAELSANRGRLFLSDASDNSSSSSSRLSQQPSYEFTGQHKKLHNAMFFL